MRPMLRRLAVLAGAAFAVSAAAALAQQPPQPPAPPAHAGHAGHAMPPAPPAPPMVHRMRGHRDPAAHAQHLRDVLQLRADQEPALQAYLTATKPRMMSDKVKDGDKGPADAAKAPPTTLERLDRQAEHMAQMAAMVRQRADATRAFYGALSPAQRKAFDALGPEMGPPGMMMRHVEMRHDGGKGDRTVILKRKAD